MNDEYTVFDRAEFIFEHVFWALVGYSWYNPLLFRCVDGLSLKESRWILLGCIVGACLCGIIMDLFGKRENGFSVFLNIVTGYGIYCAITFLSIRQKLILIVLFAALFFSLVCTLNIFIRKIKYRNRKKRVRIIRRRIQNASLVTQTVFGLSFAFIIVWSGIGGFIGNGIMNSRVHADKEIDTNFEKVSDDLNMIISIGDGSWNDLSVQERLDVLQSVANVERYRLGISNELNVGAANLSYGTKGYYSDRTHEIILSLDSLLYDSSWELLDTTCHEAYHSFEHRMVDAVSEVGETNRNLIFFRNATLYAYEFANYVDGDDDFCSYYEQAVESDARDYAEEEVEYYYWHIMEAVSDGEEYE